VERRAERSGLRIEIALPLARVLAGSDEKEDRSADYSAPAAALDGDGSNGAVR
jgi:hypothetical protein